jgi:hypothetical protein
MQFRIPIHSSMVAVLVTAFFFGSSGLGAEEKDKIIPLELKDGQARVTAKLTKEDPQDTSSMGRGTPCKVYSVELKAGKEYQIDMVSKEFDAYLRLETPEGKQVAADDDSGGALNARIIFLPVKDGKYRVITTTFANPSVGEFTLTVRQRK